ncbi:electron transfer flavoprotein subunit alpha/FixB family protein [Actinomadura chibensis]|uniref:Electron transfer flavoprotein subunit alpha/FixB family protein n=1 Tax=Actinomadura chibensis TaxID=392828 RepID=A0A5D0ND25_9ACTN|nr:FAD-binding protein [Actinomadura chibensis]TYB42223.1 electron transfer flavoprotein subunit alpha/FixB family protein [Actinomadura chibensis]
MRELTVVARDLGTARSLLGVAPTGMATRVVLLGAAAADDGARGLPADRVVAAPGLTGHDPAALGPSLAPLLAPFLSTAGLVVLDSGQPARDLAGWLCASLDLPVAWAVERLGRAPDGAIEAERPVLDGGHRLVQRLPAGPVIVLARPGPGPETVGTPVLEHSDAASGPSALTVRPLDGGPAEPARGLAGARVVVSVGRGVGGPDAVARYRRLAELTGAALGASRAAVDGGWLPFAHQVGQTGATVAPDLYVAFGISGAVQHTAGMRSSGRVVAVNTDPDAPIVRLADLVITADANEVADALLRRLEREG